MKKCRGTHKDTFGLGCGKLTEHRVLGLGKMCGCYSDFLFNTEAGKLRVQKATLKATAPRRKAEAELQKGFEENNKRKSLSKEIEKTQRLVNAYVRKRDEGKPCISQNIAYLKDNEAGHLFSKKTHSAIRFDLDNIHGQSIYANRHLNGDFDNYLDNLPNRIGKERTEALKQRAAQCKKFVKKWTIAELEEIQENIKKLSKEL